jgi:hypothetical protein
MAMYLQQKDVEATILNWIQAACMFMVDEVCVKEADFFTLNPQWRDVSKIQAVLKEKNGEWEAVRFTSLCTV